METREIKIGEDVYRIARFKGLKASLAGALISRAMREVPEIQERVSQFRRDFRKRNTIELNPALAKLPAYAGLGLTSDDFAASGGTIELPEEPDTGTLLVNMFPALFELVRKELQRFFALLVISNADLEAADDADDVDAVLDRLGKTLMRKGDLDELLELLVIGGEVFKEQMMSRKDQLGKLPIPILQRLLFPEEKEEEEEEPILEMEEGNDGPGESTPIPTETSPSPSQSSPQPSSTDSPSDSDGTDEQLSMASLGTS